MNRRSATLNQIGEQPAGVPCREIPSPDRVATVTAGFRMPPPWFGLQSVQLAEPWWGRCV